MCVYSLRMSMKISILEIRPEPIACREGVYNWNYDVALLRIAKSLLRICACLFTKLKFFHTHTQRKTQMYNSQKAVYKTIYNIAH